MKAPAPLPNGSPVVPDRLVILTAHNANTAEAAAIALRQARLIMPKLTGWAASRLTAVYGEGWFGIKWLDDYVWWNEHGTRARTMRELAGKTIPMWLDDPTGTIRSKNPKAKTRTMSGRVQVLLFRRATKIGQRKIVKRRVGGRLVDVTVPTSYPGAPGRIANREARQPLTTPGRVAGRIARANVGVRWYNPGISARYMLAYSLAEATRRMSIHQGPIYAAVGK